MVEFTHGNPEVVGLISARCWAFSSDVECFFTVSYHLIFIKWVVLIKCILAAPSMWQNTDKSGFDGKQGVKKGSDEDCSSVVAFIIYCGCFIQKFTSIEVLRGRSYKQECCLKIMKTFLRRKKKKQKTHVSSIFFPLHVWQPFLEKELGSVKKGLSKKV